ncbi:MAG: aspartate ammonia-lyase [Spirochaetaceae bacterium]|jgi:aspartate ammonia-lyase|nr:aspartate ammonia-lyase [Spirochaetaceae bacterium]
MRTESDILGELRLPDDALYGIHSLRARDNFALNYRKTNPRLLRAIVTVKKAAALTWANLEKSVLNSEAGAKKFGAVAAACDELLACEDDTGLFNGAFITDALQGGAGTSTNMNVNEVIANLALLRLGEKPGAYDIIHPLDDVNRGQSTNDVYPTALRIASILLLRELSDSCAMLQEALQKKENEYDGIKKLGRTELMDAVPVTLGAEFGAYAQGIARDRWRLYKVEERLRQVNIGGAAVGLLSADDREQRALHHKYQFGIIEKLRELTGIGLALSEYPMDITQNNDVFVEVSGLLKALSVNLMKIAGDFRLMNSGPAGGIGELKLAPVQAGSTIMPGKVNPVIAEMTMQAAIKVQANDYSVCAAASRGEFELNALVPLIADALLESLSLLDRTVFLFRTKCVETLTANPERCKANLEAAPYFAAAYAPLIGYDTVSRIITDSSGRPANEILEKLAAARLNAPSTGRG